MVVCFKHCSATGGLKIESRKIIKFGSSSHVISLPKTWLDKNKINKGDMIFLNENSNSELILSPQVRKEKEEKKEIVINIDNKNEELIKREITAAYINNFHTIKIIGENLEKKANSIRKDLRDLMALEIMEQTKKRIIARDFLNMKTVSIKNLIRRIDIITRAMISDSKSVFEKDLFESIYSRDEDVNRLTFLIYRVVKYFSNNPSNFGMTSFRLLNYWQLVDHLEKTADESKRLARIFKQIKLSKKQEKELLGIYSIIEKFYLDMMKSYYTGDKALAYKLASTTKTEAIKKCDSYLKKYYEIDYVPNIIEKFKVMINHIHTIGRIVYD